MADMNTTKEALKPCPFCRGEAKRTANRRGYRVECSERFEACQMNMRTKHFATASEADAAWNTRPTTTDGAVEVVEKLKAVLRKHHQFADQFGTYWIKTDDGEFLEMDLADGYADSTLAEETTSALWLSLPRPVDGFAAGVAACVKVLKRWEDEDRTGNPAVFHTIRALLVEFETLSPTAHDNALVEAATNLHKLADELCDAVDAAGEDVGGHRGSLTILAELGPATDALSQALTSHREKGQ